MLKNCKIEDDEIVNQPQADDSILTNSKILADEIIQDILNNSQEKT